MTEVAHVLGHLLEGQVLDPRDIARVAGSSLRSVSRWRKAQSAPRRGREERLLELKAVVDLLRGTLREEPARLWLRSPNPELGYEKPLDLLERGEYRRVIAAVLAMAEGVTA